MRPLKDVMGEPLHWVQPKAMSRRYELRTEDDLLATLCFESAFGSLATVETADGSWTFKRVGFFKPRVTVRESGAEVDLVVYTPRWTGSEGTLEFAGGRTFQWRSTNFWATRYEIGDASGNRLIEYKSGSERFKLADLFKTQALVTIDPLARGLVELPLLVSLGWYLIILLQEDSAAAASAATAAAS
jgi:hypothetical protein